MEKSKRKKIRKIKWLFTLLGPLLSIVFIIGLVGGTADQSAPIKPPATEEQTYSYKYIGSELGTPWDIVLLSDAILADQKGEDSIEEYNPLLTSLQFCIIKEKLYEWIESTVDTGGKDSSGNAITVTSGEWVYKTTKYYYAKDEILQYLGYTEENITYKEAANLVTDINNAAESKSNQGVKYEASLMVNNNYEDVLRKYIKLNEDNIENVMELYNSKYLIYLYGYDEGTSDLNIKLPELVKGKVTRMELVQVAASLMNYPYLFGGKSPSKGAPNSALDCSGFVDWVYIQCFGKSFAGGTEAIFYSCKEIDEKDLKIGDLGFYRDPAQMSAGDINHVGIYVGKINGKDVFIHCGGSYFGYKDRPKGRVGISINQSGTSNTYNNITGGNFSPAMKGTEFKFFRRPQYQFTDDTDEE